jgi:hypothetical protein
MGLINKVLGTETPTQQDTTKLSLEELEFLLLTLKAATLKGEQVESFYNLVLKLQNQYTQLQK